MKRLLLLFTSISLLLFSACSDKITINKDKTVIVGTFNLEWFGDGVNDRNPRTENDYKNIADIIKQTGIEVLGVEEVENGAALERLIKYLPDYSFYVGKEGRIQNVGVLFKKSVSVQYVGEYMPMAIERGRNRPGLVLNVKKGNFDWTMMVVHFKSTSRYDDTPEKKEESIQVRKLQADILKNWADSVVTYSKEKDIIIVGDFNDAPLRRKYESLDNLYADTNLKFLTDKMNSCKFKNSYTIDQIVVSKSALNRFVPNSESMFDFNSTLKPEDAKKISDHCPVFSVFNIETPDND